MFHTRAARTTRSTRAASGQPCDEAARDETIMDLVDTGQMFLVRCPGCQLGYVDPVSGLPYAKPMEFWTSLATFRDRCAQLECKCSQHAPLLGTGRTRDTAQWPDKLDNMILESLLEQIENDTMHDVMAVHPRRQKRVKTVPDRSGGRAVSSSAPQPSDAAPGATEAAVPLRCRARISHSQRKIDERSGRRRHRS